MFYLGIDPGIRGAITVLDDKGNLCYCSSFPTVKILNAKGRKLTRLDLKLTAKLFSRFSKYETRVLVEEPLLMPGQSVFSTFNTGHSYGIIDAFISIYLGKVKKVKAKEWQDKMITERTEIESKIRRDKRKQLKLDSIATAHKLFPTLNLKISERSKKEDDGKADSALIAYFNYLTTK